MEYNPMNHFAEKIDVYAFGNIFHGRNWKEYKIDGRISEDQNDITKCKRFKRELPKFVDLDFVDTCIPYPSEPFTTL
jgi:hypothetical protein